MDPYWRPDPIPSIDVVQKIETLFYLAEKISDRFNKFSEDELKENNFTTQISGTDVLRLRSAIKAMRGISNDQP